MRIAFIGTRGVPATYSGFETCVEQVGRRLVERSHEVVVYCRSTHYRERPAEYLGMQLRYLPAVRQKHLETLSHTALSALRLPGGTAVVCMGVGNAPVVRWLELVARKRTVFNVDGADWQRDKWGRFARWYLRTCEEQAARSRSLVVADALAVQDYYKRTYKRDTELVAYGADPPSDRGTDTLERFGLAPQLYVLWVGRLVPENAPGDFLEGIQRAGIDAPAVVVGDASYAGEFVASLRSAAPPNAVFTGYQFGSAYQQLTAHAGVFVLAATVGGTHPVLVEQMAAGNAILARETDSNKEVLGDAGLYWRTPAELAVLLRQVWPDRERRQTLGNCARQRARERYSWDEVTTRYLELCERSIQEVGPIRGRR
jgi:glycosyltransferase involved in cell wall biosynthesis